MKTMDMKTMEYTLLAMAAVASRVEYEGAEIIAARIDKVSWPQLQLWAPSLPDVVRERGVLLAQVEKKQYKFGYVEDGVTVFWLVEVP